MKIRRWLAFLTVGLLLMISLLVTLVQALEENERYANTPDDMIPYRQREPYVRFFLDSWGTGLEYMGPGREYPEPTDLESVKIGFVGPLHRVILQEEGNIMPQQYFDIGQHMLRGAELAVEAENARGGYSYRLAFALIKRNDPVVTADFSWLWGYFSTNVVDLC